jgi:RHS repeat-associated protein
VTGPSGTTTLWYNDEKNGVTGAAKAHRWPWKVVSSLAPLGLSAQQEQEYVYNPDGSVNQMIWKSGGQVAATYSYLYNYDGSVKNVSMASPYGSATPDGASYTYDTEGKLKTQTNGNNTMLSVNYDDMGGSGFVTSYNWKPSPNSTTTFASYGLTYDLGLNNAGRLTQVTGTIEKTFHYDQLGRLDNETNGTTGSNIAFTYDLAGNLGATQSFQFNAVNQLPSGATYDADGNTLSKSANFGGTGIYTYDSAGHLLTQKTSVNAPPITYAYDNMGHRVKRTVPSGPNAGVTFYIFAGDALIGEVDSTGTPKVIYTWGVNGLISQRKISAGGVTPPGGGATASAKAKAGAKPNNFATKTNIVAKGKQGKPSKAQAQTMKAAATMRAGATVNVRATASMAGKGKSSRAVSAVPVVTSQTYYYHFGPSGETKQLTDGSGNVTDTYSYTAYGVQTSFSGTTENPFRYGGSVGYYSDASTGNTGIILCTNRWYSPEMGRWLTRDPIGYAGGENLYEYCAGDPIGLIDPSGLQPPQKPIRITDRVVPISPNILHMFFAIETSAAYFAEKHYMGKTGRPLWMGIEDFGLGATLDNISIRNILADHIRYMRRTGDSCVSIDFSYVPYSISKEENPNMYALLHGVNLHLKGRLRILPSGQWQFLGRVYVHPDVFEFEPRTNRDRFSEQVTAIGRAIPGRSFTTYIEGAHPICQRGW